jgi:DNA-binding transcriptional LysR family regulator
VIASPDYLARCGTPNHPSELIHHQCLGYTIVGGQQAWQFLVDGKLQSFPLRSQIIANNGEVLTEAAAQGWALPVNQISLHNPLSLQEK